MPVKFHIDIPEHAKVVVPKSMNRVLEGERLKELISVLQEKKCGITILVADTLQKYNVSYQDAQVMGNKFLSENAEILRDVKVIRWAEYIASKQIEFDNNKKLIESKTSENSLFYKKMVKTHEKCRTSKSKDLQSSLLYQKEEYAVILSMSEFDYLLYPQNISSAMAQLYKEFPKIKPQYGQISFPALQAGNAQNLGLFKTKKGHEKDSLTFAARMLLEQIQSYLSTSEISENDKDLFKEKLNNLLTLSEAHRSLR